MCSSSCSCSRRLDKERSDEWLMWSSPVIAPPRLDGAWSQAKTLQSSSQSLSIRKNMHPRLLLGRFPLPRVVVLVWLPTSPTAARLACNHLRFMAGLLLPCLEIQIFYSFIIWSSECPAHLGKIPKMSLIKSITLISKCLLDVDCHLCLDCFFFLVWLLRQAELRTASGAIAVTAVLNIRRGRREGGS